MFVDTHCHLNMIVKKEWDAKLKEKDFEKIKEVIKEAKKNKVEKIITVGTNVIESLNSIEIAKRFEGVFACIGIHPCDCKTSWKDDFLKIKELIQNKKDNKIVAIGETGLDFYHKPYDKQRQQDAFNAHIELALENDLPVVIHVRDSAKDILDVLKPYKNKLNGVIHCFMQDKNFADKVLDWGFYLGINAPITYPKNEWFRDLIVELPLDRILLETDAPFLPPQELRGKQNLPSYIPIFAKVLADLKNIDLLELEKITTNNVKKLFGI